MNIKKYIPFFSSRFFNDHIYLLFISFLLLVISIFTDSCNQTNDKKFAKKIQQYITKAESSFTRLSNDSLLINELCSQQIKAQTIEKIEQRDDYIFITTNKSNYKNFHFWSTQMVLPDSITLYTKPTNVLIKLQNGYYYVQQKTLSNAVLISLLPIKWQFNITNDILKNNFIIDDSEAASLEITYNQKHNAIYNTAGKYIFSIKDNSNNNNSNGITTWLRILSVIPILLFIHFCSIHFLFKKSFKYAILFLGTTLFFIRLLMYQFALPTNLRQFELFDPSIYGSGIVLRSLGDLLINAVVVFWLVGFTKKYFKFSPDFTTQKNTVKHWALVAVASFLILLNAYCCVTIIRSLVADSHISFDVVNFFSLNIFSVIGFFILCFIAITFYYLCTIIIEFILPIINNYSFIFFLILAVQGLLLLSCRIGSLNDGTELFVLIWLLLFIFLLIKNTSGFAPLKQIVSRLVFWLFFFSASIAFIIINENNKKELLNRKHYAEIIAAKTDAINDVLLNSMLTEFRPEMLAEKFYNLTNIKTAAAFRDSLISNNFNSYTDKYDTKVLVFDSAQKPLNNKEPLPFNALNGILNSQTKATTVNGLFYYDAGYEKFNYIAQKIIRNTTGNLLGYAFIIISPRSIVAETMYPELFSRAHVNAMENSTEYAYAIYSKGKLINNHNDYAFSTIYTPKNFTGKQFLLENIKNYTELWYNVGSSKQVVIVKENRIMLELITLFSYLFCSFLLLVASFIGLSTLLKNRFNFKKIYNSFQLTIRQQVHGTIIFFSVFSFVIIGAATILFFINRYTSNNKESLGRTIKIMQQSLSTTITADSVNYLATGFVEQPVSLIQKQITNLALIHGIDINFYNTNGSLIASSLPLPYTEGIVSVKMQPTAYFHLHNKNEIQYFQEEQIAKLKFVSEYIPVKNNAGKLKGYLNIPYFTSQRKLKEEISNFLITIINLNAFIFLIAGIVALIITNRITNSFSFISEKMKKINLTKTNEKIIWNRNDEIGNLVKEYNKMLVKLDESAAVLARTERESAWQEMAKQVAHEIKNPLTPMKLSMQYLQKSIENDAPNIKELSAKVSATLVEQIDYLSNIAGEFSRFATIENAKPENFIINELLQSLQQLHNNNAEVVFSWKITLEPIVIFADKTHINRVLTNLILNGIQAVKEYNKPQISIQQRLVQNKVQIIITDNGTGIDIDAQQKIFTPNFTTKSSGTGLGLAMSKRMVEQAGGTIGYTTSQSGTSFLIELPVV